MTGMAPAFLPQVGFRTGAAIKGCSTIALASWTGPRRCLIGPPSLRTEAARDPLRQPDKNLVPSTPARYVRGHTGPSCTAKGINLYYRGESGLLWASRRFEAPLQDHRLHCKGDELRSASVYLALKVARRNLLNLDPEKWEPGRPQ